MRTVDGATQVLARFAASVPTPLAPAERGRLLDSLMDSTMAMLVGGSEPASVAMRDVAMAGAGSVASGPLAAGPVDRTWLAVIAALASGRGGATSFGAEAAVLWGPLLQAGRLEDPDGIERILHSFRVGALAASGLHRASGYDEVERGFVSESVFGVLGAALGVVALLQHDAPADQRESSALHAIAIAASHAGGLIANRGTTAGLLSAANAARDGMSAALLAILGLVGTTDMLEGRQGYGEAFFGLPARRLENLPTCLEEELLASDRLRLRHMRGHISHQRVLLALGSLLDGPAAGHRVERVVVSGIPPNSEGSRFAVATDRSQADLSLADAVTRALRQRDAGTDAPTASVELRYVPRWDPRLEDAEYDAEELRVDLVGHEPLVVDVMTFPRSASRADLFAKWYAAAASCDPTVAEHITAGLSVWEGMSIEPDTADLAPLREFLAAALRTLAA